MSLQFETKYRVTDNVTQVSAATFNAIHKDMDMRLGALEGSALTADAIASEVTQEAIDRVNTIVSDLVTAGQSQLASITALYNTLVAQYGVLSPAITSALAALATAQAEIVAGVGTLQPQFDAWLAGLNTTIISDVNSAVDAKISMDPVVASVVFG